ncbi:hypothetical protein C4D60_Mb03t09240 [Musa balbisiana]|uniref:Uncharacterized protein n=1 Tax=Musa balbisiana TaxID=52838 RepID=A0A4S8JAE0_MUSBA|nr:hypothetical protein C4D60_Mb03t09240 [Musa balbisiana]
MRRGQEEGIDEVPDGGERRRREVLRYRRVLLPPSTDLGTRGRAPTGRRARPMRPPWTASGSSSIRETLRHQCGGRDDARWTM